MISFSFINRLIDEIFGKEKELETLNEEIIENENALESDEAAILELTNVDEVTEPGDIPLDSRMLTSEGGMQEVVIGNVTYYAYIPAYANEMTDYSNVPVVVYFPGSGENNKTDIEGRTLSGIFTDSEKKTTLDSIVLVPFKVGNERVEKSGGKQSDKLYGEIASSLGQLTETTFTNNKNQTLSIDPNKVILSGFSAGSEYATELLYRMTSNPEIKERANGLKFSNVVLASCAKYASDKIKKVDTETLADYKGKIIYFHGDSDKDAKDGAYSTAAKNFKDKGLLDEQFIESHFEGKQGVADYKQKRNFGSDDDQSLLIGNHGEMRDQIFGVITDLLNE